MLSRHPKRGAFTLVELLVVIGIIAVLISILLPTLNKARTAANVTKCLSNLRQVGMAMKIYAHENKDYALVGYSSQTYAGYTILKSTGAGDSVFSVLGPLYVSRLMKTPDTFYCPVQQDPLFQFNTPQNPWPPDPTAGGNLRAGYTTRPERNWRADPWPPAAFNPTPGCIKLSKIKNKALATDTTGVINNNNWRVPFPPHKTSLNVMYGDISARSVAFDTDINKKINKINTQTTTLLITELLNPTDLVNNPGLWDLYDRHNK